MLKKDIACKEKNKQTQNKTKQNKNKYKNKQKQRADNSKNYWKIVILIVGKVKEHE